MHGCINVCICIDGALPNGSISVLNACRLKTPDGELNTVRGYAFRPDDKEQGKIEVVFGGKPTGDTNCEQRTEILTYYVFAIIFDRLGCPIGTTNIQWHLLPIFCDH